MLYVKITYIDDSGNPQVKEYDTASIQITKDGVAVEMPNHKLDVYLMKNLINVSAQSEKPTI